MITTEHGRTEVKVESPEELFKDMLDIITTFIAFSVSLGVKKIDIEHTLVEMIADGFRKKKKLDFFVDDETLKADNSGEGK